MVGETELNYWTDPGLIEKLPESSRGLVQRIQATFPSWKNVSLYKGDQEVAPGVRSVDTFGHTPGHTSFHLSSGDDEAMLLGDLTNNPVLFLSNLDWQEAHSWGQVLHLPHCIACRALRDRESENFAHM